MSDSPMEVDEELGGIYQRLQASNGRKRSRGGDGEDSLPPSQTRVSPSVPSSRSSPSSSEDEDDYDDDTDPAAFDPETADFEIPMFDHKKALGSDKHLVYDPTAYSEKKAIEISKFNSPNCHIFTLRLPYDEPGGVLEYFQQFQAAYYLLWIASYLSTSNHNKDISTHILVIKEDTYTSETGSSASLFDMIKDGVANKDYGFYFAEIHLHDDDARAAFSDTVKNCMQLLFNPREVKDVGPSGIMQLKESIKKHYSEEEASGLKFFQSREDFARGLVQLGQYQKTIISGQHMPNWAKLAPISDILTPFEVEKDNDDPPNIQSCTLNEKFGILFSRENTFEKLLRPQLVGEFRAAMTNDGEVFLDRYRAYNLPRSNIPSLVGFKDMPGSATHWLTKLLIDPKHREIFHQETYIDNQDGLKFLDDLVLEKSRDMDEPERLSLVRRYWAGNHPLMEPYAVNLRETLMHMFKVVQAGTAPENMGFFVTKLDSSDTNGCRVGSIYLKQLWFIAEKFEFTCKLHSIRIVLQYLRDTVFFHEVTMRDPPGANLFGDAGGGKSHLFNIVKQCSVNGMFEDCAWESRQGGLRNCGKKIKLNHEGKPSKQVRNGQNEAEMSLEKVGHSQGRRECLEIHRMGSDGRINIIRYKNLGRDWNALNIAKNLIAGPLLDRAINKSTNAQTPDGRNVNSYVQAASSGMAQERIKIAHDELRHRLYYFLGYDTMDAVMNKDQDSELFSWIINQAGAHVNEFEIQGLLSGSRETGYAYLISRAHTLHTVVSVLFYDLAVPEVALLNRLRSFAQTQDQHAVVDALEGMCIVEKNMADEIVSAKPLPFIKRFMTKGDCYLAECLMFQTVDAIVLGLVAQTDPHMQNDIKIVKSALKTLCQNHGNEGNREKAAGYKINIDEEDILKYTYVEIGKDQVASMIENILRTEGVARSGPTIESALQFLYTHIVNDGTNSTSNLAIKTSQINGAAMFFRKRLFNGILTKCEEDPVKNMITDVTTKMTSENNTLVGLYESDPELWAELIKRRLGVHGKTRMHEEQSIKRSGFRAFYGVSEPELIVLELQHGALIRDLFKKNKDRESQRRIRELVANLRENEHLKMRVESIRFYYDIGFGFLYVPPGRGDDNFSKLKEDWEVLPDESKPEFWEGLSDRKLCGLFRHLTTPKQSGVWDLLSAEELKVVYDRQGRLSETGDIIVTSCSGVGMGANTMGNWTGKPCKGVQYATKNLCFLRTFNSGNFSRHNEADNFVKEGNSLTITRRVLGLFKSAGEQNKNPIHIGIQSMLKHLNITAEDENTHFFLNEPIEKGSLRLGEVFIPKRDDNAKIEDIRMHNVGYIPEDRRRNLSQRMANKFASGGGEKNILEKKGSTNPEETANLAWYNRCRIAKAIRCPNGTSEEKRAAIKMNKLIYERLASYAAVNRCLRNKSKSFN